MATHDLVGTWKLVDWTVRMNGGRTVRPFGGMATGLITYTGEQRMVATLMRQDRPLIGTRSFNEATAMERASAAAGYLSYAGSYEVVGDQVHHHVELSLFPDWVGGTQVRHIAWLDNDDGTRDLELSDLGVGTARTATIHLRWHRITEERST
jgi:Lipocalin-like domain